MVGGAIIEIKSTQSNAPLRGRFALALSKGSGGYPGRRGAGASRPAKDQSALWIYQRTPEGGKTPALQLISMLRRANAADALSARRLTQSAYFAKHADAPQNAQR